MIYKESESTTLEFKQEIPKKGQIIKTAIGFCNLHGGRIIIGVDDSRNIVGINEGKINDTIELLHRSIYDASTPRVFPKIYSQRFKDKVVLVIEISEGMNKPYFYTSEGIDSGTYIRMGSSTIKASSDIIRELQWHGEGKYYDEKPLYRAKRSDLDDTLILDFLKNRKPHFDGTVTDRVLKSYKLLAGEQSRIFPTVGAVLLFGSDPQKFLSESFIICTHYEGVSGRKAIATVDCCGNLFQQIDEALQFIFSRLYKSFVIRGIRREEALEIPESAVREILINAVAHRNYSIDGPIKVSVYADRLEIFSPGLFPGPLNVNDLEQGITYIRNIVITRVFREAGIAEKLGSGFITLFSSYRDSGLEKPTVIEGTNFIKCILPRKNVASQRKSGKVYADSVMENGLPGGYRTVKTTDKSKDLDTILGLFHQTDELTMRLVLEKTGWARATAGRRLKELMDAGGIEKIGSGRYCHYRLIKTT